MAGPPRSGRPRRWPGCMRFAEPRATKRAVEPSARLGLSALLALLWIGWLLSLPPRPSAWIVTFSGAPLLVLGSWLGRRSRLESWRSFVARTADMHALAAILLVALGVQFEDTHGITTDGVVYFSQLRSLIFDRDFDLTSELAFLGQPARPSYVVPIGPMFLWLPGYLAVAAVDALGRAVGLWSAPENPAALGLTLPYARAALVASFAAGATGLVVLHRHLRQEFGAGVAFGATLLTFGATPLVWYMVYEPSMTHAASFGFVALFVICAVRWTSPTITPGRATRPWRVARRRLPVTPARGAVRARSGRAPSGPARIDARSPRGCHSPCRVGAARRFGLSRRSGCSYLDRAQPRELRGDG